jgi:queuine/archaeosine tRNA-ribosyltransferase
MYRYARKEVSMDYTLNKLLDYERRILEVDGVEKSKIDKILTVLRRRYVKTLKDRPWEKCDCSVCKEVGVDVIIFREGWRNGSRAYHNVRQFYLELNNIRNKIKLNN